MKGERDELDADDLALEASILADSFARMCERFWLFAAQAGTPFVRNRATDALTSTLQRVAIGELWRVLIAMPSGVGKSTFLALYEAWRLARRGGHRVIHMTHAQDLANTHSLTVRRIVESDDFRRLFPHVALRADEATVKSWATTVGGRYLAVGVETSLLGRRVDEAVLDDPLDANDRFSAPAKERLWQWFESSLATRLDGARSPIVVVHQRLGIDDLIGRLAEQRDAHGEPLWHLVELPAEDDEGCLLAPTILTREKLDELKARNPRVYACMFLQRPSSDDGATISRTAWRFHAPSGANPRAPRPQGCAPPDDAPTVDTPEQFERIVISCDPTFGGTKSANDFCSIQVWGAAGPGRYLLARWKKKSKQREQREQLRRYRAQFPTAKMLIEKSAGGQGLGEELEAEGERNLELVPATASKAARLENVSPTIERGFAYLPIGLPGLADFVEELAGSTRHDDDQDACSQALHWLNVNCAGGNARERFSAVSRTGWLSRPALRGAPTTEAVRQERARQAAVAEQARTERFLRMRELERRLQANSTSLTADERRELSRWLQQGRP